MIRFNHGKMVEANDGVVEDDPLNQNNGVTDLG